MLSEDLNKIRKFSKSRIIKNIIVISCSFLLVFTGFDGLSHLQSTINKEKNVGTLSQAFTYIFFCISALFLPKYVIQKIGCKYSILISELCYIPWMASNFYPHWSTLLPSAALNGLAASTLWSGMCTYFNKASVLYCSRLESKKKDTNRPRNSIIGSTKSNASLEPQSVRNSLTLSEPPLHKTKYGSVNRPEAVTPTSESIGDSVSYASGNFCNINLGFEQGKAENVATDDHSIEKESNTATKNEILQSFRDHESINALFFGYHSLGFRSAIVWGNLLSYLILKQGNASLVSDISSCSCGAYFCNTGSRCLSHNIGEVTDERRYLLSGIFVCLAVSAFLLLIFGLDQIEASKDPVSFSTHMMLATWNHCKKKEQMLLVPLTTWLGLAQGFYMADFNKAYVGCAWGTYHIGLVTIGYGTSCGLSSSISGWLVKHVGRIPVFSFGIVTTIGTCILLLTWPPNASQSYVFYLIAVLWGIMMGTTWLQLPAFYGVLFKEDQEAAFASICLWESVGFTIAFVFSIYLCTYIKIYIVMFVASIGFVGYIITEKSSF